jgi:Fe-S oxidoreductase
MEAQALARKNVSVFKDIINEQTPLLGIEPSGILSFRDEYPRLVNKADKEQAVTLGMSALMIEEFLWQEASAGRINSSSFTKKQVQIKLHGHCHQKALSSADYSAWSLSLPENYHVDIIPSGCCGMAGSFGYEKEHYDVSMKVGELVLLPAVREATQDVIIAAPGTSCRHQIKDGTGRQSLHPVEILYKALV